jgi:Zn-dependent alcohol dehydrogenase
MKSIQGYAAVTEGDGTFRIADIDVDAPRGNEVLVAIKACGICHTDYDSLSWGRRLVIGHEGAGDVVAVGPDAHRIKPGDRVVISWSIPCGTCFQCTLGNQHLCENHASEARLIPMGGHATEESTRLDGAIIHRSFNIGTLSRFTLVREEAVVPLHVDIPYTSACIIGCGVMTGYGSAVNAARVQAGSSVVVFGTGGVGLNVIQGARISGARRIIAVDANPNRLNMAREFGATDIILADRNDKQADKAVAEIKRLTDGRGADYAFECTGVPELGFVPLLMVRHGGTVVQVSGIDSEVKVNGKWFMWDKKYINPLCGQCRPQIDIPRLLDLYQTGQLRLDELVTRTYAIDQVQQAFDDMLAGKNAKGVIVFD